MFSGELQGSKLAEIRQANANEISSENVLENIDALCDEGYYAFDIYLMNSSPSEVESEQLKLSPVSAVQEILSSADTDYGLKNCVRVAFALYDDTAEVRDVQGNIVGKTYDSEISQVAIWEPNAYSHSEYVKSSNQEMNAIISNSTNGVKTYAVNEIPESLEIEDIYKADNASAPEQQTVKTGESISEIVNLTDTSGNAFNIATNKISKIRVYIWLEGQDVDCVNWASHSSGINVTIGLTKEEEEEEEEDKGYAIFDDNGTDVRLSWQDLIDGVDADKYGYDPTYITATELTDYSNGKTAFYNCSKLKEIRISDTIDNIGLGSFLSCTNLNKVYIPKNVTTIGQSAFYGCSALNDLTIENGVKTIGPIAFSSCTNLTNVTLPDSIEDLGASAFAECSNLTTISLSKKLESINEKTFYKCKKLTNVEIPVGVKSIGKGAFIKCYKITDMIIPNTVSDIEISAFEECETLATISIPQSVESIGNYFLASCYDLTKVYVGSDAVKTLVLNSQSGVSENIIEIIN